MITTGMLLSRHLPFPGNLQTLRRIELLLTIVNGSLRNDEKDSEPHLAKIRPKDTVICTDAACEDDVAAAAACNYSAGETRLNVVVKNHITTLEADFHAILQGLERAAEGINKVWVYTDCTEAVEECRRT